MADQGPNSPQTTAAPTDLRRRPNATIELEAGEVRTEPAPADAAAASAQPDAAAPAAAQSGAAATASLKAMAAAPPDDVPREAPIHRDAPGAGAAPPPLPPPPPRGSLWSHAGAGAVGAGLVGAVLVGLWITGTAAPPDNGADAAQTRVSKLESQLSAVSDRDRAASADLTELGRRLAKLEQSAGTAAAAAPGLDPKLAERLAAAEKAARALAAEVVELRRRADENAAAVRQAESRAAAAANAAESARAASRGPGLERQDLDGLTNRVAQLEGAARTAQDALAKQSAALAGAGAMRYVLSTLALRLAVDEGVPFKSELAIVKPLAPAAMDLAALDAFAETGVPRIQALSRELMDLAPAMLRVAEPAAKEGFLDRLQANAERLVRIRRVEEAPGDDPAAIIGRIEIKAGRPDIADTLAEFAKLPPAVRAPAEGWIKKARARQDAIDLSRRLKADAFRALGKEKPE